MKNRFSLERFPSSQMIACGAMLRGAGEAASTQEEVAQAIATIFYDDFDGHPSGHDFALARVYRTMAAHRLPAALRQVLPEEHHPQMRCLVLLGTMGEEPAWCDRHLSTGNRVLGLEDEAFVRGAPMLAGLFDSFGVDLGELVSRGRGLRLERRGRFGVFHVPRAHGSPFIPDQDEFVIPYGVASAIGFGGPLPDGEIYAFVGFSRTPVARRVADHFPTIARHAQLALSRAAGLPCFVDSPSRAEARPQDLSQQLAAMDELLDVQERAVGEQARELESRNDEMRIFLDNLDKAILRIGGMGGIGEIWSSRVEQWFDPPVPGELLWSWLEVYAPEAAMELEFRWRRALVEGHWRDEDALEFSLGRRTLELELHLLQEARPDLGAMVVIADVTSERQVDEARLARQRAEEENRAKSAFLASMSHELRTPLNAIIGYSEIILEQLDDPEISRDDLRADTRNVESAGRHLLTLITNILDLSKIEAGHMTLHSEPFPLDAMFEELRATLHPLAARRQNTLDFDPPPEGLELVTDRLKLKQILLNLLSNAAKFTRAGQIALRVRHDPDADTVTLEVVDTGEGIPAEVQARIFEAFEQARGDHSEGGTGLGLTLVRQFTSLLHGTISLTSTPGVGSRFTVIIPRVLRLTRADEGTRSPS